MGYSASNPPIVEQTTQSNTENLQTQNTELDKLLNERKSKISVVTPAVADIHRRTVRVEKDLIAGEKEFITKRGKYIEKGKLYHIHHTNDLETYYMTGGEHNQKSQFIFRTDIADSDIDYYNILNKQSSLFLESSVALPTEKDYKIGKIIRHFAKKSNDDNSPAFEISVDKVDTSPLYKYVSLDWYIKGDKDKVSDINKANILIASQIIPSISKLIPDFQYYRADEVLNPKQQIMDRLGIVNEQNNTQQEPRTEELNMTLRRGSKKGIGRMKINREGVRRYAQSRSGGSD
tara:strand:+ start:5868 stop:6737 length:870 start_codon:yes stop_codon:yes gene_type:complete